MSSPPPSSSSIVPQSTDQQRSSQSSRPAPEKNPSSEEGDDDDDNDQAGVGDGDEEGDLPMSMTASIMLTHLPKDASQALKEIEAIDDRKVSVRFQPISSAPILKQKVFKISASSRFSVVLNFLRKKLGVREGDGLFCYVNSVFAPGLDEGVGNLFRCFKVDDQLIVSYSITPAFG